VIGGCPWEWKAECDVHCASERSNLYRGHADIVVRSNNRVELAAHRPDEHRVSRKWSGYSGLPRGRLQNLRVLIPKPPAITAVRIESAKCNARSGDAEPLLQS
jgi:hypothetical protein